MKRNKTVIDYDKLIRKIYYSKLVNNSNNTVTSTQTKKKITNKKNMDPIVNTPVPVANVANVTPDINLVVENPSIPLKPAWEELNEEYNNTNQRLRVVIDKLKEKLTPYTVAMPLVQPDSDNVNERVYSSPACQLFKSNINTQKQLISDLYNLIDTLEI